MVHASSFSSPDPLGGPDRVLRRLICVRAVRDQAWSSTDRGGQSWLCLINLSLSSAGLKDWQLEPGGGCIARMRGAHWRDGKAL